MIIEIVDAQLTETGLPFYTHITRDDGGNVLSWDSILIQENALYNLENQSSMQSNLILSNISAPGILQLALEESGASGTLSDYDSWASFLNATVDENTTCTDGADEDLRNAASLGRMAIVHKDLDFEPICNWLLDRSSGDPTPSASSTLWILEVRRQTDPNAQMMMEIVVADIFIVFFKVSRNRYNNCL